MARLMRTICGTAVAVTALLCFAAAVIIDREPAVPQAPVPAAADVRAGIKFARIGEMLLSAHKPVSFGLPRELLESVHRLVGHARSNLRLDAQVDGGGAQFRVSKRLMSRGWLNLAFRLDQASGGATPQLSLYAGGWRSPDALTAMLLRIGVPLMGAGDEGLKGLISGFRVEGDTVRMTARVPKRLVGGLQAVLSPGPGMEVDMDLARSLYGDMLGYVLLHPHHDYAAIIRHMSEDVTDQAGLQSAVVALMMLVDGPRVRRLAGDRSKTPPCPLLPEKVLLHGRPDLPKHWTASAVLALFMNHQTARAVGLWKELDDSLPGGDGVPAGSGFSFVDLAADAAGIAIGMAARDGRGLEAALKALRSADEDDILPRMTLRLPEAIPLTVFEQRYGPLEQPPMLRAEAHIHAILRQSALYRVLPARTP